MEIIEGNIRITSEPRIHIGDVSLETADSWLVKKEIMALVKRIDDQRQTITRLRTYIAESNLEGPE